MYARLISFAGADPGKRDSAIEMIRGTVIPMLQSYDGFDGYIALYDEEKQSRQGDHPLGQQGSRGSGGGDACRTAREDDRAGRPDGRVRRPL